MRPKTKAVVCLAAVAVMCGATLAGAPDSLAVAALLPLLQSLSYARAAGAQELQRAERDRERRALAVRSHRDAEAFRRQLDREELMRKYGGIEL